MQDHRLIELAEKIAPLLRAADVDEPGIAERCARALLFLSDRHERFSADLRAHANDVLAGRAVPTIAVRTESGQPEYEQRDFSRTKQRNLPFLATLAALHKILERNARALAQSHRRRVICDMFCAAGLAHVLDAHRTLSAKSLSYHERGEDFQHLMTFLIGAGTEDLATVTLAVESKDPWITPGKPRP